MKFVLIHIWQLALCIAVCLVAGCDYTLAGKWQYKEIHRVRSPDGQVEAVLIQGNAGATTSLVSEIYLVPTGQKVQHKEKTDSVFAADHVKALKTVWKTAQLLDIQYDEARILQFKNFWQSADVQNFRFVVEIRLTPTSADFSLPAKDRVWGM